VDGRLLGRTGLTVSPLGWGTVKLGRNRDVKYPQSFELPDDAAVEALVDVALEEGVVFWDTAPAYGRSEERLGRFVERHRERIVLSSKAGEDYGPDGSSHDFSADAIVASVHRSLRRLRTDRLDVLLIHSDGRDDMILDETDVLEGVERLRTAGDVRCAGISAKSAKGIDRARAVLDVVMAPVNANHPELVPALRRAADDGLGIIGIKVLEQGHAIDLPSAFRHALLDGPADVAVVGTLNPAHLRDAAQHVRATVGGKSGGAHR